MRLPDLTLAVRNLVRRPGFAITAILLLALGAGANAAVFSVVRGILLKPLPYPQPEQLVAIWPDGFFSQQELDFMRGRAQALQSIAAISPGWMMSLIVPGAHPIKVTAGRTTANFFTTLGVEAAIGRTILPGEAAPGRNTIVVLSMALYERQFGGNPNTIGRRVLIDGVEHEVVGVMPRGFEFLEPGTDLWAPFPYDPTTAQYRGPNLQAFARSNAGVEVERASAELQAIVSAARATLKKTDEWGREIQAVPLQEVVTGSIRSTLLIVLAAVGLILLLAAVNLGTLVLGRSIERTREMAVRTALGASRTRLVRQLIAEQALLAVAGALAGLALARLALPMLVGLIPPEMPRQSDIALDGVVFATVFCATVVLSVLLALVPVVIAARPELQPLLRQNQSSETRSRRRALGTLVAAQIAMAVVLGTGAGLMLRTLWNLQNVDPGFRAHNVLTFRLQTTSRRLNLTNGLVYYERFMERLRALPGVTTLGAINHLPMSGYNWTSNVWRPENAPAPSDARPTATWRFIGWDYFAAMQIPVLAGRDFTPRDHLKSQLVTIVNETLARQEFGRAETAVGRELVMISAGGEQRVQIVGVIRDVRFQSLAKAATPEIYRPLAQTFMFPMAFVVRTTGDPAELGAAVRQAAFDVDPTIPVAELQPLTSLISGSLGRPRLLAMLLSVFAAVGLALGVIGVYGVVAYRVRQQEREFGIRIALGAGPERIARSVLSQGVMYAMAGILMGVPTALLLGRLMDSVVFGITTDDPLTFVALPLAITATTLLACAIPARRAARVDPVTPMRAD